MRAASLYLLAGSAGLVWIAPELAAGAYLSPRVAGVTHLFTLGWLTTTIFGALCQLLPVALGAPVRPTRVAHAAFWTFTPGVGIFAAGVATGSTIARHAGIGLLAAGIVLEIGNVAAALYHARTRDVIWAAIALALGFLASTLVLGILLLHNLHTGFLGDARLRLLALHLHVAVVGWVLIMIVGVSHRLLPMFLLATGPTPDGHDARSRCCRRASSSSRPDSSRGGRGRRGPARCCCSEASAASSARLTRSTASGCDGGSTWACASPPRRSPSLPRRRCSDR